jgi:hypothetical protein
VLWALALVGAVAAAYAYATRSDLSQARAESERVQAFYAARGACIQAVKDLSTGVRRAELTFGAERVARDPNIAVDPQTGGVQIGDLPVFPPEMAAAGGFLGAIAERMNQIQRPAQPRAQDSPSNDGASAGAGGAGSGQGRVDESDNNPTPVMVLGRGTMDFSGATVEIWLESETGKLNINVATRSMLERLLLEMGLAPPEARELLDDIEGYRLSLLEQNDAGRGARSARNPLEPLAGRQLRNIEELINAPSVDAAMQERLMGVLTVYGSGAIDPNYAPLPVLKAAGLIDQRPLEFILAMQAEREPITPELLRQAMGTSAFSRVQGWLTFGAPGVFTARTRAVVGESTARYLIRVEPGSGRPGSAGATVTRLLESREDWL